MAIAASIEVLLMRTLFIDTSDGGERRAKVIKKPFPSDFYPREGDYFAISTEEAPYVMYKVERVVHFPFDGVRQIWCFRIGVTYARRPVEFP